jgi:hypothetical protein
MKNNQESVNSPLVRKELNNKGKYKLYSTSLGVRQFPNKRYGNNYESPNYLINNKRLIYDSDEKMN